MRRRWEWDEVLLFLALISPLLLILLELILMEINPLTPIASHFRRFILP